jgi:hypothetical protein
MADRAKVSGSGDMPLRVTGEAVMYLSSLRQFHGIPDSALIRLAERRTRIYVPDRWVAIALILSNRILIPVPTPPGQLQGTRAKARLLPSWK